MPMQMPANLNTNHTVTSVGREGSKKSDYPGIHASYMGGEMSHKLTDQTGIAKMTGGGGGKKHSMSSPAEGKHSKGLKRGMGGHKLTDLGSATSQGNRRGGK